MKLRHSIAERRLREFDAAAGDAREMVRGMTRAGDADAREQALARFCQHYPATAVEVRKAARLVMVPEHRPLLGDLLWGYDTACDDRCHAALRSVVDEVVVQPGLTEEKRPCHVIVIKGALSGLLRLLARRRQMSLVAGAGSVDLQVQDLGLPSLERECVLPTKGRRSCALASGSSTK